MEHALEMQQIHPAHIWALSLYQRIWVDVGPVLCSREKAKGVWRPAVRGSSERWRVECAATILELFTDWGWCSRCRDVVMDSARIAVDVEAEVEVMVEVNIGVEVGPTGKGPMSGNQYRSPRSHAGKRATNLHPPQRRELEPRAKQHKAMEDLMRVADVVNPARPELFGEACGVEQRPEDVRCAAGYDVVEAHHCAGKGQTPRQDYVAYGQDCGEAEGDEG